MADLELGDSPPAMEQANYSTPLVEIDDEELRITVLSEEPGSASFRIADEDHTLGNALRYIVMKNPEVEFCGYSIPHPSENFLNFRIQVWPECETRPVDVLLKGLDDLEDLCIVVREKFTEARDAFGKQPA